MGGFFAAPPLGAAFVATVFIATPFLPAASAPPGFFAALFPVADAFAFLRPEAELPDPRTMPAPFSLLALASGAAAVPPLCGARRAATSFFPMPRIETIFSICLARGRVLPLSHL
jgi:hypothetical protein